MAIERNICTVKLSSHETFRRFLHRGNVERETRPRSSMFSAVKGLSKKKHNYIHTSGKNYNEALRLQNFLTFASVMN